LVIIFQSGGMSFDHVDLQEISPPKHVTFRPKHTHSPQTKNDVSSFAQNKIVPSDFSRTKSATPLLKRTPHESIFNLSDSKVSQNKSGIFDDISQEGPLKDLSEIESKSPNKPKGGLNLSIITSSPMSFWSVSPRKILKSFGKSFLVFLD